MAIPWMMILRIFILRIFSDTVFSLLHGSQQMGFVPLFSHID